MHLAKDIVAVSFFLLTTLYASGQVTSTFNTDADGWTFSDINNSGAQVVIHSSTGGNPGGRISSTIPGSQPLFFNSPAKFIDNLAYFSYGQNLSFDIQVPSTPTLHDPYGDVQVRISSGGFIVYTLPSLPAVAPTWSSFTIKLDETAGWRVGGTSGPLATKQQMIDYLSNAAMIRISGRYASTFPATSASIDNVQLGQKVIPVAPVVSGFNPTLGNAGSTVTITGSNFDPVAANNKVFFGGVAAPIVNASATSIAVTVPQGARYSPITVINLTTGTSTQSAQPFNPTFNEGGRIIPASLSPRQELSGISQPGGIRLADVDGDGWNDLLMAKDDNSGIEIYRNLGAGGTLSAASFATKITLATGVGFTNGSGLEVIDFDNDGKLDLATSGWLGGLTGAYVTFRSTSTPGNISFEAPEIWIARSDESPVYLAADIDGDGYPDLMSGEGSQSSDSPNYFWITQNMSQPGNIEFGYSFGVTTYINGFRGVTVSDLDNDGKPEILVRNASGLAPSNTDGIDVLPNNSTPGKIVLGTPVFIPLSSNANVLAADFNLDGKNDLVTTDFFSGDDISIWLNSNSGGPLTASDFSTEVILSSNLTYANGGLSIADMNGDGKPDIVANDPSDLGLFENVYTGGTFDSKAFIPAYKYQGVGTYTYPRGMAIADLNGDNKPDVVMASTNATYRLVLYENKNVHTPEISLATISPLKGPVGSTVTITGNHFSTTPADNHVHFGTVEATVLSATETQLTVSVPPGAQYAPVSVTRNQLTATYHLPFSVTFSTGATFDAASFAPPVSFNLTTAYNEVIAGDLNNDGKPDLVAVANTFDSYVFRNTHTSGSISISSLLADDTLDAPGFNHVIGMKDFDGDGLTDIISYQGQLHRNISTTSEINLAPLVNFNINSYAHSFSDFNHDGKTDLIGTSFSQTQIVVSENRTTPGPFVYNGDFSSIDISNQVLSKPAVFGYTVAADFDNNGWVDIVATNAATDNFTTWRNVGSYLVTTATFISLGETATGDNPARIFSGDLDVDGNVDLMVYYGTGTSSGIITVFRNTSTTGVISFARQDYTLGANGGVSSIADLDGDGRPEIVVVSEAANAFWIFKNNSTPGSIDATSFVASAPYAVTAPRAVTIADINLDGKPEIILTSAPNSLLVYENLIAAGPTIAITTQPVFTYACEGSTATFTVEATGTTNITYRWQKFNALDFSYKDLNDGGGYTGVGTSTLSINTATTGFNGNGQYRARINGDLATEVFSNDAQLTINSLPSPPDVTGDSDCVSPATLTLTATGASDGDYNWYAVATGGVVLATNSSFTTPSITTTTTYYVSIEDTFCESTRVPVVATINLLAKPAVTFDPPIFNAGPIINLCEGDVQKFSAPAGFTSYTWSTGEITPEITIDQSGTYSLMVEDASGCLSPSSDPLTVVIHPYPLAEITVSGTTLMASAGDTYRWYQNGNEIVGATSQSIEFNVLEYGVYTVDVTDKGCTSTSEEFTYLITGTEVFRNECRVYPNPFHSTLTIESAGSTSNEVDVIDMFGRSVKRFSFQNKYTVSTDEFIAGLYVLIIHNNQETLRIKITKSY